MKSATLFRGLLGYTLAALGFAAVLLVMAWMVRPDLEAQAPQYSAEQLRDLAASRNVSLDVDNPPRLVVDVDYSEGSQAAWYPKGEPDLLAPLVESGQLPPVAQRVGPEPVVVRAEQIGTYGGTWFRLANSDGDVFNVTGNRMSYPNLVRFSPQGDPVVPHIAKGWDVSDDYRTYTFHLRKGMRWSDGAPFTADDILYWWQHEANDKGLSADVPQILQVRGVPASLEKIDDYTFRITFPHPNGLFLGKLATFAGAPLTSTPAHYLRQYHPTQGDPELIAREMDARNINSKRGLYWAVKSTTNPAHPRLWPWVYRTFKPNPPQSFVRNPYYFMVDTQGNQLPYIDRLHYQVKNNEMVGISAANGDVTLQARHLPYDQYTLLMSQRDKGGYRIFHWYPADRSSFVISPNLNRRIEPDQPATKMKHDLLNTAEFRQALSLGINRADIIQAEYNNTTRPAQNAPGPDSPFYEPSLWQGWVEFDPDRANRMLDELGLDRRDDEGYRTFPDGSRMTWYLNLSQSGIAAYGPGRFVVDDWREHLGLRTFLRLRSRNLFYREKSARLHDFNVWGGNNEFYPLLEPRYFLPSHTESNYAIGFARWYMWGGMYGADRASMPGAVEPPAEHPLRTAMELYEKVQATGDPVGQREIFGQILKIAAENVWAISICTPPPVIVVVDNDLRNVPRNVVSTWDFQTPGNAGMETYFLVSHADSPGAVAQMRREILNPTLPPDTVEAQAVEQTSVVGSLIRIGFWLIGICLVVMVALRHPYIARRLLIMIPTLLIISVVVFSIIQLPPGNYLTNRIMEIQESGDTAAMQEIDRIRQDFHLDESLPSRYARWMGLHWFTTLRPGWVQVAGSFEVPFLAGDPKAKGLLQGNLGRRMQDSTPVNQIVGDRITLTVIISLGTILFTWAIAIPTGIVSAVKQYSSLDYVLTFVGFIGMCVPAFLLALILMYFAQAWFGVKVSGLFSSEYGAQPEWTWGKFIDLLKHIWVPVIVLGVGGTAGMIRVMRGNLLDELKKPYVTTARAKGVRPVKLLLKYPVRMALNPFISGIGYIFPALVSGGAIVAMVLSLPTVGPLMLDALMTEDFYLAGSMLMVLSLLGVVGTLVSDLLLLWLDPRIRYEGGSR
ncbi:MAG: ABC transporter substrate-binding protein [Phycisphaerae bacterium]